MNARILVATSAADEGFDLQVACKVVHWDLSSSPATLMQRNGRVARLGQVADVTAYYLILTGTHEERKDSALQTKFAELGIDDEALKSRILGSLSEEEEIQLEQAIEENEEGVVGDILRRATNDNEKMDKDLADIRTELQFAQVLSRTDLADRLTAWQSMGLPDAAVDGISFHFDSIRWDRPVFGDVTSKESAVSKIARIGNKVTNQELVFDPEFLLFGPQESGSQLKLAGLPPWIRKTTRHGKHCIKPYTEADLLGTLLQGIARLRGADFLSIPRYCIGNDLDLPTDARWLLVCTHPLREAENTLPPKSRPFLTYYVFTELFDGVPAIPLDIEGADAEKVHELLCCVERHALKGDLSGLEDRILIETAKRAGVTLKGWIESVTRFGAASFLDEERYFVPIPVALVSIVP